MLFVEGRIGMEVQGVSGLGKRFILSRRLHLAVRCVRSCARGGLFPASLPVRFPKSPQTMLQPRKIRCRHYKRSVSERRSGQRIKDSLNISAGSYPFK